MPSLHSPLACSPAEDLRSSRVQHSTAFKTKNASSWRIASWNVRSLLDSEGPVETARQGRDTVHGEDRRIDEVVKELCRYGVKVAGLQETKWFGSAVYHVSGCVVLAAGRPVPTTEEALQRGEGVALVLMDAAVRAWREAGERWKMWSSRIVSAQLKTGRRKKDYSPCSLLLCTNPSGQSNREDQFLW